LADFYRERYYQTFGGIEASPRRQAMLRTLLEAIPRRPPGRLLDVGCGAGHLLALARSAGWEVAGVDPSLEACAIARKEYGLHVQAAFLELADLPESAFDVITLVNVLDQVPNPVRLLQAARRALKPGGLLVARIPNGNFHRTAWTLIRRLPSGMIRRLRPLVIFHPFSLNARAVRALFTRTSLSRIRIINAPLGGWETSLPCGAVGRTLISAARAAGRAGAVLATGRFPWTPSLLAFGEREAG
jgi:SAM-dependent methyltransferase